MIVLAGIFMRFPSYKATWMLNYCVKTCHLCEAGLSDYVKHHINFLYVVAPADLIRDWGLQGVEVDCIIIVSVPLRALSNTFTCPLNAEGFTYLSDTELCF